jgi:hypothetical protein
MPLDVDAPAAGAPGELGVLARRHIGMCLTVELRQPLQHYRAGRHVDAQRQRLGGEHGADEAAYEQFLDGLLERRDQPSVVRCDAAAQRVAPFPVAEHLEVLRCDAGRLLVDDAVDLVALVLVGEPHARIHALPDCRVAADPAEDEGDRRQQSLGIEPGDDVRPVRRPPASTGSGAAPAGNRIGVARAVGDVPQQRAVHGGTVRAEEVEHPRPDEHVLPERDRSLLVHDHLGLAAYGDQPLAELLGVGHRRRQRDEPDGSG